MKKRETVKERLVKYSRRDDKTGCLLWVGSKDSAGYGVIRELGKLKQSHRVSYKENKGTIPKGLFVLHSCDTPACIEPKYSGRQHG